MKKLSISQQLMMLVGLFVGIAVLMAIGYYFTLRRTVNDAAALTKGTVTGLNRGYELLAQVSATQTALQSLLRQKDPDELEKGLNQVETARKNVSGLITATGSEGKTVVPEFERLVERQKAVIEPLLKGNNGLAYDEFLSAYNPQYEVVLKQIEAYNARIQQTSAKEQMAQQQRVQAAVGWSMVIVAIVLVGVTAAGWTLKQRIAAQLQRIAATLSGASASLVSSADHVSAASASLAQGATEQASSLEETSASLEEMSSMTRRNADNAQTAKELTGQTRAAAENGVGDMQAMSEAMAGIKNASDSIAKIIRTIDEISFQTNILALNAAVEAARAGESGMGFAVVADEVRALAGRCAEAARETSTKIEDSISRSQRGVELNEKVARGLAEIADKARRVDELTGGISLATTEQSDGIRQVTSAVTDIEKVTQSNAGGAEESASAAQELKAQATLLKQIVVELSTIVGGSTASRKRLEAAAAETALPDEEEKIAAVTFPTRGLGRAGSIRITPRNGSAQARTVFH